MHPERRLRRRRRRHLHAAGDPAHRPPLGRADRADRRPGHHLSRDRRARPAGAPQGAPRRERPAHGRAGWPRAATAWSSGRPTCRRRPGPARRGSCWARTTTSRPSDGSRRRRGVVMTCSAPDDCAEIERRHATGAGLLVDGGSSRGNLLSGEADEVILTVSRIAAEKSANPGYRAILRQRLQRHPRARPVHVGGRARVGRRRSARSAATSGPGATAAATTRSCGRACASSSATSSCTACSPT